MAIDLQKLEQKFNALLDDPNFVTDFEQWLEARNVSQNSGKPIVSGSVCDGCKFDKKCNLQDQGFFKEICRYFEQTDR